jgi:hypothetical protein
MIRASFVQNIFLSYLIGMNLISCKRILFQANGFPFCANEFRNSEIACWYELSFVRDGIQNFRLIYKVCKHGERLLEPVLLCNNWSNFSGRICRFGKKVTLHKLPKDTFPRRAWIRLISRKKNGKPTSYTRVCSDDFKDGVGPTYSNRNKVPCENLPQTKSTKLFTRREPRNRTETDTLFIELGAGVLQHHL